ncbi:DNA N-6-adenine-methyltransferase [uncultured Sphingomonas sp.]|uniref:DNA N-6-adenine-methyltransferase n=1 Tax=uncultured Sphingomonas sp. TaxID=158754 RepID=UPI002625C09A|nr:DNA N-6-adenine-methyltransferase [uncultured Sphingomonas sp.]
MKAARRSAGWSQRTLADRIGVDAQTVKRLENGVGSVANLVSAMDALDFRLTGLGPGSTLAEQLRSRRRTRSLSLQKAASLAGLARGTVSSLESGGGSVASLLRLLAVIAPQARRRAPERSYWGQADKQDRDSRFTPSEFMEGIYAAFGEVDLDPCGHFLSPVVARRRILLSEGGDGLTETWSGRLAFVNPPFSELLKWLRRAHDQWRAGNVDTVVCLVPVRTDSTWFHQTLSADADLYLLQGRVRFLSPAGKAQQTPFSLMLVTLGTTAEQRQRYAETVQGMWVARALPALQHSGAGAVQRSASAIQQQSARETSAHARLKSEGVGTRRQRSAASRR